MLFILEPNKTYTHSGNTSSRAFLLGQNLNEGKKLIICDTQAEAKNFAKILGFSTHSPVFFLEDTSSVIDFTCRENGWFIVTKDIFEVNVRWKYHIQKRTLHIRRNDEQGPEKTITELIDAGYIHSPHLSKPGSYKKEGDTLSIRTPFDDTIVALSFFDTVLDEILLFDANGQFIGKKEEYFFPHLTNNQTFDTLGTLSPETSEIFSFLQNTHVIFIDLDFWEPLENVSNLCQKPIIFSGNPRDNSVSIWVSEPKITSLQELETLVKNFGKNVHFLTKHTKVLRNFLEYNNLTSGSLEEVKIPHLESFAIWDSFFIADDILGDIFIRNRTRKSISKNLDLLLEIRPGDYVVHRDHGVGIFREIVEKDVGGNRREYMHIAYRENDVLFVPLTEIHRISKYIGEENPTLTRLSGNEWRKTLERTTQDVERIARELLVIYANRRIAHGFSFLPFREQERLFKEGFPYIHTPDQQTAIWEILEDMELDEPMDRLLSGDVGFGKTEVAMNAIYRAFMNGKQSILISPLVVLAYEHAESLRKRFESFGVRSAVLTRLSKLWEVRDVLRGLSDGTIDCVVGTHRILGEWITFKNLWLLVIDEEHRFWVLDKEKINALKSDIDVLSLSATPIPRSLNLALSWVKKISVLSTPPPSKKPITTIVTKWNELTIKEAMEKEFARGGQVIFLHNRVASIDSIKKQLQIILNNIRVRSIKKRWDLHEKWVPEWTVQDGTVNEETEFWMQRSRFVTIGITHGRMDGIQLEDVIMDFKAGKYDILLSTTVIENGVNFLNANTIFIDDAPRFGLAQLHQLRGRVGRKDQEAFCYLLYHENSLVDDAKKRLLTIVNHSELGAGFEIAMRDLEIRGAGDILGIKQSGKTSDTGLSLYLKMLEEKIEELQSGKALPKTDCKIELDISYFIEDDFFDSELDKIRFFRNIESIDTLEDLAYSHQTFAEANETLPESFENLFLLLKTRIILRQYGVTSLKKVGESYVFEIDPTTEVATVRRFLDLDRGGDFTLITVHKIKVPIKKFRGDKDFLERLIG